MDWKESIKAGPFSKQQSEEFIQWLSSLNHDQLQWLRGYFAGIGVNGAFLKSQQGNVQLESAVNSLPASLFILYGTQTGNAEKLARAFEKKGKALGIEVTVKNMALFKVREFKAIKNLAVIVSTQGIGEPPIEAAELHTLLHSSKAPALPGLRFSVLALGDTSYAQFCQTGKDFDAVLEKLGATRLYDRRDCDVDYEDDAVSWMEGVLEKIQEKTGSALVHVRERTEAVPEAAPEYSRKNPFEATLLERINLNGRGSSKETLHVEFDLKGSGIQYNPGDALGVYAANSKQLIESLLRLTNLSGEETVKSHAGTKKLLDALTYDYELTPLTALSVNRYAELTDSSVLRKLLVDSEAMIRYLYGRDVLDMLKEIPFKMDADSLLSILRKNTPRMYSIASSAEACEEAVHLLVSVVRYQSYSRVREGLCSSFLADRVEPDGKVKVFVENNTRFRLPADGDAPIIMIGPGTGVAPFRAFMQHREATGASGKSWLFFGERNFTTDFLYQAEWQQYLKEGVLTRCDVAFSRDTGKKVYVQDKMKAQGKELYAWLEEGAHLYVCGDAHRMAKDVDRTLREIVGLHGNLTTEKTEEYIKYLQLGERYQMDVY